MGYDREYANMKMCAPVGIWYKSPKNYVVIFLKTKYSQVAHEKT